MALWTRRSIEKLFRLDPFRTDRGLSEAVAGSLIKVSYIYIYIYNYIYIYIYIYIYMYIYIYIYVGFRV